jgi:hypothetical protein
MRILILVLLLVPMVHQAQINRSANELAKENIRTWLLSKIFKDQPYKPGEYGELKSIVSKNPNIAWLVIHRFEIEEPEIDPETKAHLQKPYKFAFYLDKRMTVVRAESAYLE